MRLSAIDLALYRAFARPAVRAMVPPQAAEAMRRMHPLRLSCETFGSKNPWSAWIRTEAERVRERRRPASPPRRRSFRGRCPRRSTIAGPPLPRFGR